MIMVKNLFSYFDNNDISKEEENRIFSLLKVSNDFLKTCKDTEIIFYEKENEEKVNNHLKLNNDNTKSIPYIEWLSEAFDEEMEVSIGENKITVEDCINKIEDTLNEDSDVFDTQLLNSENIIQESKNIINEALGELIDDLMADLQTDADYVSSNGFEFIN